MRRPGLAQVPGADTQVRPGFEGMGVGNTPPATPEVGSLHRIQLPGLHEVIHYLIIVLQQSPVLTTLDLSGCQLPGPMVEPLCSALKYPKCRLKTLR